MISLRFSALTLMILTAALTRLLPHWPNFSPIGAMALFGGAYFTSRRAALAVPLAAMLLSDLVLSATHYGWDSMGAMPVVYACFAAIVLLGMLLRRGPTVASLAAASLGASIFFFLATNFAVWLGGSFYPHTPAGLIACYTAAVPFFQNTLLGDLFFSAVLFGGFELAQRRWMGLRAVQA